MSAPVTRVAGVILAAGMGTRFKGGNKLLAPLDGKPIVQHVIDAANASSLDPILLVTGHDAEALLAGVSLGRARAVHNPDYATGQASSLVTGVRAAGDAEAVVVLLGDQPWVAPTLVDALVARQHDTGAPAVMSSASGRRSPPTLLHRDLWHAVVALSGDLGARDVLAARDDVALVDVGDARALADVDTASR